MVLWQGREEAYGLLAKLLAAEYGLPQLPELARQEGGKPFFPQHPDLHFNVSHSGGLALCGAGSAPLGVDIEEVRPRRSGLARYICSPAEYAWYEELGGDWESLYTIWTLKEARVKCTGQGPVSYTHLDVYKRQALCDGAQSITPDQFSALMDKLRVLAPCVGKEL